MSEIFAKKLKELRKQNRIFQKDLTSLLNVRNTTISMWETGATEPDLNSLTKIAVFFGVSTDYLLGLEDEYGNKINQTTNISHKIQYEYRTKN